MPCTAEASIELLFRNFRASHCTGYIFGSVYTARFHMNTSDWMGRFSKWKGMSDISGLI